MLVRGGSKHTTVNRQLTESSDIGRSVSDQGLQKLFPLYVYTHARDTPFSFNSKEGENSIAQQIKPNFGQNNIHYRVWI